MTDFDDKEKSHYDDLIRELRDLKKFIEDDESEFEDDAENSPDPESGPANLTEPGTGKTSQQAAATDAEAIVPPNPPDDIDDEPPTLREAIHRPERTDEMQLDLLSVSPSSEPDERDDTAGDTNAAPSPPLSGIPVGAVGAEAQTDEKVPAGENTTTQADDEVLTFVLDLSDRILNAIEDRLLERNGEILPEDLRDELRDSIGDILYEWCER